MAAGIDVATVEALAPDQASLKAAAKLAGPAKWPRLEQSAARGLVWGECQGSGANPYRAVADLSDRGTKCTCPSRKFPCKHALALLWLRAEGAPFGEAEPPDWVEDWLGRRRGGGPKEAAGGPKSIAAAREADAPPDPAAARRAAAAAARRAEEAARAVAAAMEELDGWLADQLRLGLMAFVAEAGGRCRAIAARLVDGKAAALAGRLDEMPARLLAVPPEERPRRAMVELGLLALLVRAHRAAPDDPDVRRAVRGAETREAVLADPAAPRVTALWEVLGERVATRRDGLVSQSTWLMASDGRAPRFALLLDHTPASAGRRGGVHAAGEVIAAELAFYPSRAPLRAVIAERGTAPQDVPAWPEAPGGDDPLAGFAAHVVREPFALEAPVLIGPGRVGPGGAWRPEGGGIALPLASGAPEPVLGMALDGLAGLWDGARLDALAARGDWGRVAL